MNVNDKDSGQRLSLRACRKLVVAQITKMAEAYIELAALPVGKNVNPLPFPPYLPCGGISAILAST